MAGVMQNVIAAVRIALASVRANLVPMLMLWVLAGGLVAVYYAVPGGSDWFGPLRDWQTHGGWVAAFLNRVVFLGLVPGVFLWTVPSIRPKRLALTVVAYSFWGGGWGVFDDAFYPLLAHWFGHGTDFATLALKTVVGQIIATVLVGLVPGTLFFRWVAADFSLRRVRAEGLEQFFRRSCMSLLLANWIVWIPVNLCTYAFPVPLQIQLVGLAGSFWMLVGLATGVRMSSRALKAAVIAVIALVVSPKAEALTIRSQGDRRLWQTVFDRSAPLTWNWAEGADSATVTFGSYGTIAVTRTLGDSQGGCPLPVALTHPDFEDLVTVTLTQRAGCVEVSCETAPLAFVRPQSITVRTKAKRDWRRVKSKRISGYDPLWWQVSGLSGYEVFWSDEPGFQTVTRTFPSVGIVDTTTLLFTTPGTCLFIH